MWRFTPERVSLGLAARRTVLGVVGKHTRIEAQPAVPAVPGAAPLGEWLATQPVARATVNITVSNTLSHHLLVNRNRAVAHTRERDGYARALVEEAFGLDGAAWQIAADDDPFAAQFLAVAVPRARLDEAQAGLKAARAAAGSVQTFFVREWNRWRSKLGAKPCWFAVIEADGTVLARVQRGRLASVRLLRGPLESAEALVRSIEREILIGLGSDAPRTVCMCGEALFVQAALTVDAYTVQRLDAVAPVPFAAVDRTASRLLWHAW